MLLGGDADNASYRSGEDRPTKRTATAQLAKQARQRSPLNPLALRPRCSHRAGLALVDVRHSEGFVHRTGLGQRRPSFRWIHLVCQPDDNLGMDFAGAWQRQERWLECPTARPYRRCANSRQGDACRRCPAHARAEHWQLAQVRRSGWQCPFQRCCNPRGEGG